MSDLLLRLGARALGTSAKVQPLLRSRFTEAVPQVKTPAMETEWLDLAAEQAAAARPSFEQNSNDRVMEEDSSRVVQDFVREAREKFVPDPLNTPRNARLTRPLSQSPEPEQVAPESEGREPHAIDRQERAPVHAAKEGASFSHPGESEFQPRHRPTLADVLAHLYPEDSSLAQSESRVNSSQAREQNSVGPLPRSASQPAQQGTLEKHLPLMRPAERQAIERTSIRDASQVSETISMREVQVTIGKIELHAAAAASVQAAPPPPSRSTLSLDAYLARRRGEIA